MCTLHLDVMAEQARVTKWHGEVQGQKDGTNREVLELPAQELVSGCQVSLHEPLEVIGCMELDVVEEGGEGVAAR